MRDLTGSVYGRRMYEVMRYWDKDLPEWGALDAHMHAAFAELATSLRERRSQCDWTARRSSSPIASGLSSSAQTR